MSRFTIKPFLWSLVRAIIRYQLIIVVGLGFLSLVFTVQKDIPLLNLQKEVAIEFFSAVSQSLAALLGFLIAFLTFRIQSISQVRWEQYRALQSQIDQLIRLTRDLPVELQAIHPDLIAIIDYFVPLQMKDLRSWGSHSQHQQWDRLASSLRDEWGEVKHRQPLTAQFHLQQIFLVLNNIDEIFEIFSYLYTNVQGLKWTLNVLIKLSVLLGLSLFLLLMFGIVGLQRHVPDLTTPLLVMLATLTFIALLELVVNIWQLYANFRDPRNIVS